VTRKPNQRSNKWLSRRALRLAKARSRRILSRVLRMALRLGLDLRAGYGCIEGVAVDEEQVSPDEFVSIFRGEQAVYRERGQCWGGKVFWSSRPESWRKRA